MVGNAKPKVSYAPTGPATLTIWDKLAALVLVVKLAASFPILLLSALLRKRLKSGKPWLYDLRTQIVHFGTKRVTARQLHFNQLPTAVRIATVAKQKGVSVQVVDSGAGGKIHWFGDKKGENVLLHFHGGGFSLPIGPQHVGFLHRTKNIMKKRGLDVDIAILEYSLTPMARHPTQLKQAVEALRYVIKEGYDPTKIVISGDSAGGQMAFGTISHILHPHPAIEPLIFPPSSPRLGGLVAISPWITFNMDYPSFKQYSATRDVVMKHFTDEWIPWLVDTPGEERPKDLTAEADPYCRWDEYSQSSQAADEWWAGYSVKKTVILAGEEESLRDGILEFGTRFVDAVQNGKPTELDVSVEVVVCEGEIHTECLYDCFLPIKQSKYGRMAETIWRLCEDVFKGE